MGDSDFEPCGEQSGVSGYTWCPLMLYMFYVASTANIVGSDTLLSGTEKEAVVDLRLHCLPA